MAAAGPAGLDGTRAGSGTARKLYGVTGHLRSLRGRNLAVESKAAYTISKDCLGFQGKIFTVM